MISFTPVYQGRGKRRVLRAVSDELLIGRWEMGKTCVELVQRNGESRVLLHFDTHMDLINGAVTDDRLVVHLTERVTSTKDGAIAYRSAVYSLSDGCVNECFFSCRIDAQFVASTAKYHMILLNDMSVLSYYVSVNNSKIKRKRRSELNNVVWTDFSDSKLSMISQDKSGFVYHDVKTTDDCCIKKVNSFGVLVNNEAKLPDELSMIPNETSNIPIFQHSNYRIFVSRFKNRVCLVQQMFVDVERSLSFEVSVYPGLFRRNIVIPDVSSDIPLCCANFETILLLFAPNMFLVIIDTARNTPMIVTLKKSFALGCCGACAASIPHQNCVIDIDSSEIYQIGITFMYPQLYRSEMTRATLCVFAVLVQRLKIPAEMSNLLHLIETQCDYYDVICFFRYFFAAFAPKQIQISRSMSVGGNKLAVNKRKSAKVPLEFQAQIRTFETAFPSSGKRTRTDVFHDIIDSKKKADDKAFDKALRVLGRQNDIMLMTQAAIENWITTHEPSEFWIFVVVLTVVCEGMEYDCPRIQALIDSVSSTIDDLAPTSVKSVLRSSGVIDSLNATPAEREFWSRRLGTIRAHGAAQICRTSTKR